jgi:PhnB protein
MSLRRKGIMSDWLIPYITFNGNCETAVKFYQKVLGGEAAIMHFGDAPPNPSFKISEEQKNLVMHAELRKDGHVLRFSDTFSDLPFVQANNISFSLEFDSQEETKAAFEALAEGGSIQMDLQKTFFSPLYGKFVDRFGIMWQISCRPQS